MRSIYPKAVTEYIKMEFWERPFNMCLLGNYLNAWFDGLTTNGGGLFHPFVLSPSKDGRLGTRF